MVKLSIIVPVYNVENYINVCIDSILMQNSNELEIIIVDDGSTDNSLRICQKYSLENDNIILISKVNGGVSSARNIGISRARGKYVFFLDGDDWLVENMINEIFEIMKTDDNKDVYVGGKSYYYYGKNNSILDSNYVEAKAVLKKDYKTIFSYILGRKNKTDWAVWRYIFKRDLLIENNIIFDESINIGEDLLFIADVIMNIKSVGVLNIPMIYYRRERDGSLTNKINCKKIKDNLIVCNKMINISKIGGFDLVQKDQIGKKFSEYYLKMLTMANYCENNTEKSELIEWIKKDLDKKDTYILKYISKISLIVGTENLLNYINLLRKIKLSILNSRG